jgi:outer membrane protein TolC
LGRLETRERTGGIGMSTMQRAIAVCVCAFLCAASAPARGAETRTITLKDAIETALRANTDLQQAAAQTESQEISVKRSVMDFFPTVRLSLGTSRSYGKDYDTLTDRFEWDHSNSMNLSVSSGIDLFTGFGRIATLSQSRLELEAQRKSYQRSREQVVYEAVQQFVLVVLDEDVIGVDEQYLESQRTLLSQIEAFTNAGRRPVVDLYQQQANVSDAESRLLAARRDFEVDKYRLLQVMAIDPGAECAIAVPDVESITTALAAYLPEDAAGEAMANRADLAAQRLQVEAAKKQITASRAGYWPSLSLSAGAGTSYHDPGGVRFQRPVLPQQPERLYRALALAPDLRPSEHVQQRRAGQGRSPRGAAGRREARVADRRRDPPGARRLYDGREGGRSGPGAGEVQRPGSPEHGRAIQGERVHPRRAHAGARIESPELV